MSLLLRQQEASIERLAATEARLKSFNAFAQTRYEANTTRIDSHVAMLRAMKADLESVFKRVRALKTKVSKRHPTAYSQAVEASSAGRAEREDESD
ncbi:hypothetical protein HDU82_008414 [Entophlyctis luteolus]|nr:hypothetical protein HDU82_008414 [Entophlyctis luteolus]